MTKAIVIVGFLLALAAGFAAGWTGRQHAPAPPPPRGDRGSWLAAELNLTPQQRQQMDQIWSELAQRGDRDRGSKRDELRRQRDEAILNLVPAEKRSEYDRILADYRAASDALESQWRAGFQQAVQRTRELLNEQQRARYDQIMARHAEQRGRSGPGWGPERGWRSRRGDSPAPTTAPAPPDDPIPQTQPVASPPAQPERKEP